MYERCQNAVKLMLFWLKKNGKITQLDVFLSHFYEPDIIILLRNMSFWTAMKFDKTFSLYHVIFTRQNLLFFTAEATFL